MLACAVWRLRPSAVMGRYLVLIVGIFIGQWLSFGALESPAAVDRLAREAWGREEWHEAARQWSRAVSLQPDNAYFNYMRAAALTRLGHRHAAADALQLALLLGPEDALAARIRSDLATLSFLDTGERDGESTATLENGRGVWIVSVLVNGHPGRFLLDTGSSVVVIAPAFATKVGARIRTAETLELETLAGRTQAPWATLKSLRVGGAEVRNADAVVHNPGIQLDGILGNSFLARWDVSVDPDRRLVRLRRPDPDPSISASPK
jgi:clan AA aspartic protease (TIGR02281 family)